MLLVGSVLMLTLVLAVIGQAQLEAGALSQEVSEALGFALTWIDLLMVWYFIEGRDHDSREVRVLINALGGVGLTLMAVSAAVTMSEQFAAATLRAAFVLGVGVWSKGALLYWNDEFEAMATRVRQAVNGRWNAFGGEN